MKKYLIVHNVIADVMSNYLISFYAGVSAFNCTSTIPKKNGSKFKTHGRRPVSYFSTSKEHL